MSLRHEGVGNIYVLLSLMGAGKMKDYCLQQLCMQDFSLFHDIMFYSISILDHPTQTLTQTDLLMQSCSHHNQKISD